MSRPLDQEKTFLVFVYGSLLNGLGNHYLLADAMEHGKAEFVRTGTIRAKLFTSNWAWPFMVFSHSKHDKVKGEVYRVTGSVVKRMDHLEGYQPNQPDCLFYRKQATCDGEKVIVYEGGEYLKNSQKTHIEDGDWRKVKQSQ